MDVPPRAESPRSTLLEVIRSFSSPPSSQHQGNLRLPPLPWQLAQQPRLAPAFVGSLQLRTRLLLASPLLTPLSGARFPFALGGQWMRGLQPAWPLGC